jgi:hypothetical protein
VLTVMEVVWYARMVEYHRLESGMLRVNHSIRRQFVHARTMNMIAVGPRATVVFIAKSGSGGVAVLRVKG